MFKHDFTGVEESGGGFENKLLPKGWYNVTIMQFNAKDGTEYPLETTSKKGYPQVNFLCEVGDDGEFKGERLFHTVTFLPKDKAGAGMAKHFLKVIGQPHENEAEINAFDWCGAQFQAYVIEDEYNGKKKNKISDVREWSSKKDEVPY